MEKIKINRTALLVIDVTNFCAHKDCEIKKWGISFKKIRKVAPKIKDFITKYKGYDGKVIYVNCTPWDKEHLAKNLIELYKDPRCRYYSFDKSGFPEKFYLLEPENDDIIITKNSYDAFTNPELEKILRKNKIDYLLITGIFSDGCVHATIQGGFSKGFNFIILKDLVETTDKKIRQKIQALLKENVWLEMFGKTINSSEILRFIK